MASSSLIPPANVTAISIASAQATNYVIPSVGEIFAAGIPWNKVNQSQLFDGVNLNPAAIFPLDFDGLYYNLSFLWPQLNTTGIILDSSEVNCTPQTCSLLLGNFLYLPNIPANAFFAALFGLALLITLAFSIRGRTWGYLIGMTGGLLCEILGYVGRILISMNDFNANAFYIYIICLTIGPAFLSFSIYTCLARIVIVNGSHISRFRPRTYTYVFAVCDFISLVLQGAGGGLAASANDSSTAQAGINLMIGGLAFQVFSMTIFVLLCVDYAVRLYRRRGEIDPTWADLRNSPWFTGFLVGLGLATVTIFVRSIFRVAELKQGFHSQFANDEVTFMVLEAAMIAVATICLTTFHPAVVFGHQYYEISKLISQPKKQAYSQEKPNTSGQSSPMATSV